MNGMVLYESGAIGAFEGLDALGAVETAALERAAREAAQLRLVEQEAAARVAAGESAAIEAEAAQVVQRSGGEVAGSSIRGDLREATAATAEQALRGAEMFKQALFGGYGLIPALGSWVVVGGVVGVVYNGVTHFAAKERMDSLSTILNNPYLTPEQKNKAVDAFVSNAQRPQSFFESIQNIVIISVLGSLAVLAGYYFFVKRPTKRAAS